LLSKYSQEEITNEVYKAITNSKIINDPDHDLIEFTLFGETLRDYHMDDLSSQSQLIMNIFLHMLVSEQDCDAGEMMF